MKIDQLQKNNNLTSSLQNILAPHTLQLIYYSVISSDKENIVFPKLKKKKTGVPGFDINLNKLSF